MFILCDIRVPETEEKQGISYIWVGDGEEMSKWWKTSSHRFQFFCEYQARQILIK